MATEQVKERKENGKNKHEKCFCIHTYTEHIGNINNNNNTTQKDK